MGQTLSHVTRSLQSGGDDINYSAVARVEEYHAWAATRATVNDGVQVDFGRVLVDELALVVSFSVPQQGQDSAADDWCFCGTAKVSCPASDEDMFLLESVQGDDLLRGGSRTDSEALVARAGPFGLAKKGGECSLGDVLDHLVSCACELAGKRAAASSTQPEPQSVDSDEDEVKVDSDDDDDDDDADELAGHDEDDWGSGGDGWDDDMDGFEGDCGDEWDDVQQVQLGRQQSDERFFTESRQRRLWQEQDEELRAKSNKGNIWADSEFQNVKQIFSGKEICNMLVNTYFGIRREGKELGISVEAQESIYHWRLRISKFPHSCGLASQLTMLDSMYDTGTVVELDVRFDMHLYPFYPPTVRPVWPRLENFFMGRIVCMDELLVSGWSPVRRILDIFVSIKTLLMRFGELDPRNEVNDPNYEFDLYSEAEYQIVRLSMLTDVPPLVNFDMSDDQLEALPVPELSRQTSGNFNEAQVARFENWAASGTGTGSSTEDLQAYVAHLAAQRKRESEVREIAAGVMAEVAAKRLNPMFADMFSGSCVVPWLGHLFRKVKDAATLDRKRAVYLVAFGLCRGMCCHSRLVAMFEHPLPDGLGSLHLQLQSAASKATTGDGVLAQLLRVVCDEVDAAISNVDVLRRRELALERKKTVEEMQQEHDAIAKAQQEQPKPKPKPASDHVACPLCFDMFPPDAVEGHAARCNGVSTGGGGGDSASTSECPICALAVPLAELEDHVNACLEQGQVALDAALAKTLAGDSASSGTTPSKPATTTGPSSPSAHTKLRELQEFRELEERMARAIKKLDETYLEGESEDGPEKCVVCQRRFVSAGLLRAHRVRCWHCPSCTRAFPRAVIRTHTIECIAASRDDELDQANIHFARKQMGVLNEMQLEAVTYVQQEARKRHEIAYPKMLKRFEGLGLGEAGLAAVLKYVRKTAPMIIHIHCNPVLGFLMNDTHYRNQFETSTSNGTLSHETRVGWEDRMFNGVYSKHSAKGFDRVKYGTLNITNNPRGVQAAYSYGNSYMVLKDHVRLRTTFASEDTGSASASLATCEYYAHILAKMPDEELKAMHDVATGKVPYLDANHSGTYREIQVHGPIQLDRDVAALWVNPKNRGTEYAKQAQEFARKNHCDLMWMPS